jgi:hypothetical protein
MIGTYPTALMKLKARSTEDKKKSPLSLGQWGYKKKGVDKEVMLSC